MQALFGGLIALWMTLVKYTTRWEVLYPERAQPIIDGGEGFIALTFHSRFMLLTSAWRRAYQHPHVLISRSRDGEVVAWTCRWLGLSTIRGSARNAGKTKAKGGGAAAREIVEAVEGGGCVVITPDGPRGPRQRVGLGPFRLARLTGAPVVPCSFAVRNRRQFGTWDRLVLPLPFGRGRIAWGTPVRVGEDASDAELEAVRARVEAEMNALLSESDAALGHAPVLPA